MPNRSKNGMAFRSAILGVARAGFSETSTSSLNAIGVGR